MALKGTPHVVSNMIIWSIACVFVAVGLIFLTSCRNSDALKEIVYDQTADIIDYDNPTKVYVNDSTAEELSEAVAAKETSEGAAVQSDTVQNLVVYSSDPNTDGFTAKKSAFSPSPDFSGIEASEEVCFVQSDDPDAYNHAPTVQEPDKVETSPENADEQIASPDAHEKANRNLPTSKSKKHSESEEGSAEESEQSNPAEDNPGNEQPAVVEEEQPQPVESQEPSGGNDNGEVATAYDASDPTTEPEKVTSIAAFGPAATIVEMIGGTGALVATDADTLSSGFSSVFDVTGVKVGWSGDGTDASTMDVDAIIESGAATILVYSGAYLKDGLSSADMARLSAAGITQTVIYPMTNSGNIKQDVTVVGTMLADSDSIQHAGKTESRASSYVSFHDDVVTRAANANGGLAGSVIYESGSDAATPKFASGTPTYTVLIDSYEDSTYTGPDKDDWKPSSGLAFASAGYTTTPLSYYMQAGGLVNNAADKTAKDDTGKVVAWQFHANNFSFKSNQWVGAIAERARSVSGYSLLTTTTNLHGIFPFGESFGSKSFPKVIVTSSAIEKDLVKNSKDPNGTLHPYSFVSDGVFTIMGPVSSIPSCIGFNGADSTQKKNLFESGQVSNDDIIINPTGMFSDWTQGTVESFLEAAWVNDVANGSESKLDWKSLVEDFYSTFYGYDVKEADWQTMNPEGD